MTSRLAIYHPGGRAGLSGNVFGKDVANFELFRALVLYGGLEQVAFLTHGTTDPDDLLRGLTNGPQPGAARVTTANVLAQSVSREIGVVLRGTPRIEDLAWQRRHAVGDTAYSLMGLIHTIAPPAMRHEIAMSAVAPTHAWDALICTSPSVQSAMTAMFDEWGEYLTGRFSANCGSPFTRPQLPLIPLGVDAPTLAAKADRPAARAALRAEFGLTEEDVLILWVGRLSFFEKAFPQPMMRAIEEAAKDSDRRVCFAMAGWFPNGAADERMYRQAATVHAPTIDFRIVDGTNRDQLADLWAAGDIFVSLVDNIQETFGITPLEAMACGLPVVVSDWDGYRYTVRDGIEGFLIPTLGAPEGALPRDLVGEHVFGMKSYQQYVGILAQHTAVHVGRAAEALAKLIRSPQLRKTIGDAGRRRVRETFDWTVVAPQYSALASELAAVRAAAPENSAHPRLHPVKGDPFRDFAGFASQTLDLDTPLRLRSGMNASVLSRLRTVELDMFAANWRGSLEECHQVLGRLEQGPATPRELLVMFPVSRRRLVQMALLWLAKEGFLDWL